MILDENGDSDRTLTGIESVGERTVRSLELTDATLTMDITENGTEIETLTSSEFSDSETSESESEANSDVDLFDDDLDDYENYM